MRILLPLSLIGTRSGRFAEVECLIPVLLKKFPNFDQNKVAEITSNFYVPISFKVFSPCYDKHL